MKALKKIISLGLIGYLLFSGLGCGYTTRSAISSTYKTIYIPQFLNKMDVIEETYTARKYRIYRPMLETDISKRVINKFLFDGNLKPVAEDRADVILKGEVIEFRKDPLSYTDDETNVTEYRMNLIVNLTLWDRKENKLVWQENGFTGDTTYFTSYATGVTAAQIKTDDQAIIDALDDLARRIVERTVEEW